ncbi:MAG: class I SAM-dependent methyltransferase [Nanoarchaeota archaeon]|nr:class I SAM-dependent methyltransferase [Nanoarchaeota archaeon]
MFPAKYRRQLLEELIEELGPSVVLDVGSGSADYLVSAALANPDSFFVAGDVELSKTSSPVNLCYVKADAKQLPFPDEFSDLTSCFDVFDWVLAQEKGYNILGELNRVTGNNCVLGPLHPSLGMLPNDSEELKEIVEEASSLKRYSAGFGRVCEKIKDLIEAPVETILEDHGFRVLKCFPDRFKNFYSLEKFKPAPTTRQLVKTSLNATMITQLQRVLE